MSAATVRVLNTTLQKWTKGFSDETEETHPMLAALKKSGKISYDDSGTQYEETIKYKRLTLSGYGDLQTLSFARNNLFQKMVLPWRGVKMTDAISDLERRQNRGMEAIAKIFASKLEKMKEDANDDIGRYFYFAGTEDSNTVPQGIQSFMSSTGELSGDAFATTLDSTYAGLSTARGAFGGAVKGGGTESGVNFESNDPEWDFWSPVKVNATYDDGTGAKSWANDAVELLGRAITHATKGSGRSHHLDLFTCGRAEFQQLKESQRSKERIIVDPGPSRSLLVSLGFKNVIQIDGVDVIIDPDIPGTNLNSDTVYAYGWNFKKMKLCLLPDPEMKGGAARQFWNSHGVFFDPHDQSYKYWVGLWGNFVFKPRHFAEVAAYA